ncbi:hypothetical protein BJX76DRAFT_363224 [Aspergillus varians]
MEGDTKTDESLIDPPTGADFQFQPYSLLPVPHIIGSNPTHGFSVESSQRYLDFLPSETFPTHSCQGPQLGQGFQIWPPQPYGNPQLTQDFPDGVYQTQPNFQSGHAVHTRPYLNASPAQGLQARSPQSYLGPELAGFGLEPHSLSQRSSHYSLTSESESDPLLYSQSGQYLSEAQTFDQGSFQVPSPPVVSPTSQGVRSTPPYGGNLNLAIQAGQEAMDELYDSCPAPSNSQLISVGEKFQKALSRVEDMIQPSPGRGRNPDNEHKQYECVVCWQKCKNKGTLKRHVSSKHWATKRYRCPICVDEWFVRKDKHHYHMRTQHNHRRLSKEEMETVTDRLDPPPKCAWCGKPTRTWNDFIECLCQHCAKSEVDRYQDNGWDEDDSDGGDDDEDSGNGGNGGGNQNLPSNGNSDFGNTSNGHQPDQFGGLQFGNLGAGGGTSSYQYHVAANAMHVPSDHVDYRSLNPKSAALRLDAAGPEEPKSMLTDINYPQQPKFDRSARWVDGDIQPSGTFFKAELTLRLGERSLGTGKSLTEEKRVSEKEIAIPSVNDGILREFQRLRYFEYHVYEHQKQGSFMTCIHETLIVSRPESLIVLSMQGTGMEKHMAMYHEVELGSEKHLEIPGDQLFYLAKEKDHRASEENLEAARRAPKRRAYLRVRIQAIAGILALRAAVSKTPIAVENGEVGEIGEVGKVGELVEVSEIGDAWELGIPLSRRTTEGEAVKIPAWLLHMLMFLLRIPSNLKVYVARGSLEALILC